MSIRPLSDALQKKVETEFNEVPNRIHEDLKHIKDWLAKQPHLKVRTDDQWLLSFLRGCKHNLQQTKEKLDLYYTLRTLVPEFLSNKDPFEPNVQQAIKRGAFVPLENTFDPAGPRIFIIIAERLDFGSRSVLGILKTIAMYADIQIAEDDNYIIGGQHLLIDLRNMPYKYLLQWTPNIIKKMTICFQNAYPTRPQGIHFLNAPPFFDTTYNIVKPLLTEKLKNRIGFYTDHNFHNIYKIIPSKILPKEYGGEGDSVDKITADWKQKFESYHQWFRNDAVYCSDEAKRPEKPKTSEEMFGVHGSFKQLNVD